LIFSSRFKRLAAGVAVQAATLFLDVVAAAVEKVDQQERGATAAAPVGNGR